MLRIRGVHESMEERANVISSRFKTQGVLPAFAVSCSEGILIVALNNRGGASKIRRLLDRVAFVGIGNLVSFSDIHARISADACTQAHILFSRGDMRVVGNIIRKLSGEISDRFRDLYSGGYLECEFMVVKLGLNAEDDQITGISFSGETRVSDRFIIIPSLDVYSMDSDNDRSVYGNESGVERMANAVKILAESFKDGGLNVKAILDLASSAFGEALGENLFFQTVLLSREDAVNKRFQGVYRKLS